ncbi:hypothetical protein MKX01_033320 [Papaver californicum]|nr:hypothetical protein MKX01_033320 [Papaver californicum]
MRVTSLFRQPDIHTNGSIHTFFNKRYFGKGRKDGGPGGIEEIEHVNSSFEVLYYIYAFGIHEYLPNLRWLDLDGHEKIVKRAMGVVNNAEDLLDVLISLKDKHGKPLLSTEEIKAQISEVIITAMDNPANAVEWAMTEIINQPDILRKAAEEIDMVVGKSRWVQESDIPKLNYVKACAREALRLHPIAPFNVPHVSNSDTVVSGYFIPKGNHVLLSRIGLGRNHRIWYEPLKFNPERYLMSKDVGIADVNLAEQELRFISFDWSAPPGESMIDLSESAMDLFLATPLFAHAKPRLPLDVYPVK